MHSHCRDESQHKTTNPYVGDGAQTTHENLWTEQNRKIVKWKEGRAERIERVERCWDKSETG